jgi:hypothetical protein
VELAQAPRGEQAPCDEVEGEEDPERLDRDPEDVDVGDQRLPPPSTGQEQHRRESGGKRELTERQPRAQVLRARQQRYSGAGEEGPDEDEQLLADGRILAADSVYSRVR